MQKKKSKNKLKFHHIGIFVKSINKAEKVLLKTLSLKKTSKIFKDKTLKVKVRFYKDQKNICYEIIEPYGANNPVTGSLIRKTNILNHIAYKTEDLDETIKNLRKQNYLQISQIVYSQAFKKKIVFLLTPLNFIIELIQK